MLTSAFMSKSVPTMKQFKKQQGQKGSLSRDEALKCRPVKNIQVEVSRRESGDVQLSFPVYMRPWIASVARWTGSTPDKPRTQKLQLDTLGTSVWDLIDGRRSVKQMIRKFAEDHQLQHREAEVSVTSFLRELGKRGVIGME